MARSLMFDVADYRRKKNLVIYVLTHPTVPFLTALDEACGQLREKNAVVAIIASCDPVMMENIHQAYRLTFPFLCDPEKRVISCFVSAPADEKIAALFITGRNGEVFFQSLATEINDLPPFGDILKSLDFIESQSPEERL
jgi:peroxiredoxin